jgi:hypothetical protein
MSQLTPAYCRAKNIGVHSVIIAELELRDVQRQIFAANLVIAAHNAALNQRPKTLNRVGVNSADDVLSGLMIHNAVRILFFQILIRWIGVCAKQADFFRYRFADKFFEYGFVNTEHNARHDVAFTLDCADDRSSQPVIAASALTAALIPMAVFVFAADVSFIHLNNATKFFEVFNKGDAHLVAHEPSGFVATEAHVTHDLQCAHALFAGQHEMDDLEPVAERLVGVLENGPRDMGEPIASLGSALIALPTPRLVGQLVRIGRPTTRAMDASGPTAADKIRATGVLIGEHAVELSGGKLLDWLRSAGHRNNSPSIDRSIIPC